MQQGKLKEPAPPGVRSTIPSNGYSCPWGEVAGVVDGVVEVELEDELEVGMEIGCDVAPAEGCAALDVSSDSLYLDALT